MNYNVDEDLLYTKNHEWVRCEDDDVVTVGISDYAREQLGDIVHMELPEVGQEVIAGQEAGVVESVKAASDIYSPVNGTVVEVNQALKDDLTLVTTDSHHLGWMFKVRIANEAALDELLDADAYRSLIEPE